jgi:hypothetical protein
LQIAPAVRHPILLVHEERSTRDGLAEALADAGFVGVPAASVTDALDYLKSGGPACVILLDERAGWCAFQGAQQRDQKLGHIPVVAIPPLHRRSGEPPEDQEPIDVDMLIAIVRLLVEDSHLAALVRHISLDSAPSRRSC